jgi:gamma-glutamylcyclotransferase (GGCT)/AIG2-like uncharacterized protein YtfP
LPVAGPVRVGGLRALCYLRGMLYFAYGSNMHRDQMRRRCRGARAVGPARLDGWRFIIMRNGYASIVPSRNGSVHGVLWTITPSDCAALNGYECLDAGLYVRRLVPVRRGKSTVRALTFVGSCRVPGRPRHRYHDRIIRPAAHDWELPTRYLASLQRWSPLRARSALRVRRPR